MNIKLFQISVWFIFCFGSVNLNLHAFDQVVIWGHKYPTHTHHFIHNAFYIAFNYLGYPTYWWDDNDDVSSFDFTGSLFITEGQVDGKIPVQDDCQYILHNIDTSKYQTLSKKNWILLQVYTDDVLAYPHLIKVEPCVFYDIPGKCVYMPWATDLLPDEIDQMKKNVTTLKKEKKVYWIGTIGDGRFGNINQLTPFMKACKENEIEFIHIGPGNASLEKSKELLSHSYLAPTIVGKWQQDKNYIPCRIFKNISYGQMGVTNSYRVYELFDKKIVYNADTYHLFYDAKRRLATLTLADIYELMDVVKNKHTYINRIHTLLDFLEIVQNTYP